MTNHKDNTTVPIFTETFRRYLQCIIEIHYGCLNTPNKDTKYLYKRDVKAPYRKKKRDR